MATSQKALYPRGGGMSQTGTTPTEVWIWSDSPSCHHNSTQTKLREAHRRTVGILFAIHP